MTVQLTTTHKVNSHGYPSGYKPKSIAQQVKILNGLFPNLSCAYANEKLAEQPIGIEAEGWFAIPRWEKLATTYGEALQKVFDQIKQTRNGEFNNSREGKLGPQYLSQCQKTITAFNVLGKQQQDYEILVVPCQFGLLHRGSSVLRVRKVINSLEFGLGAFAVGTMLLTHLERLLHYDDLWIDCAGNEYSYSGSGDGGYAPSFSFEDGCVKFDAHWTDSLDRPCGRYRPNGHYGSATAFLLQSGS